VAQVRAGLRRRQGRGRSAGGTGGGSYHRGRQQPSLKRITDTNFGLAAICGCGASCCLAPPPASSFVWLPSGQEPLNNGAMKFLCLLLRLANSPRLRTHVGPRYLFILFQGRSGIASCQSTLITTLCVVRRNLRRPRWRVLAVVFFLMCPPGARENESANKRTVPEYRDATRGCGAIACMRTHVQLSDDHASASWDICFCTSRSRQPNAPPQTGKESRSGLL